jgi:hypothetical protein
MHCSPPDMTIVFVIVRHGLISEECWCIQQYSGRSVNIKVPEASQTRNIDKLKYVRYNVKTI